MDAIKTNAKAVVAFVVTVLTNMVIDLMNGASPWPQSKEEWIRYLGSSFVIALSVYGVGNKQTPKQVAKSLDKLPAAQQKAVVQQVIGDQPQ